MMHKCFLVFSEVRQDIFCANNSTRDVTRLCRTHGRLCVVVQHKTLLQNPSTIYTPFLQPLKLPRSLRKFLNIPLSVSSLTQKDHFDFDPRPKTTNFHTSCRETSLVTIANCLLGLLATLRGLLLDLDGCLRLFVFVLVLILVLIFVIVVIIFFIVVLYNQSISMNSTIGEESDGTSVAALAPCTPLRMGDSTYRRPQSQAQASHPSS